MRPRLRRGAIFGRAGEGNCWKSAVDRSGSILGPSSGVGVRLFCICGVRHAFLKDLWGPAGGAGAR